jgi:uncharacterized membrane protein (DUF4010 family)
MPTDPMSTWGLAVALGCGLLIGIERERRKGSGPGRAAAGLRSFSVASVAGALAQWLAVPGLVAVGALLVAGLAALAYAHSLRAAPAAGKDPGLTTELALFVTYLVGVLCIEAPGLGAACGVGLAALLAAREHLHRFATRWLGEQELHDGLMLAALALIALPLIPAGPVPWLGGLSLRPAVALIVLILALQALAHVILRVLGPKGGLPLMGFVSGFVSSTATVVTLGRQARARPDRARHLGVAAGLSGAATWLLALVVVLTLVPSRAAAIAPIALLAALAPALLAAWWMRRLTVLADEPPERADPGASDPSGPLRLREAVTLAVMLIGLSAAVGAATSWLGTDAAVAGAALAAVADAHAAVAALSTLAQSGALTDRELGVGLLVALASSTATRCVMAVGAGGWVFARPVIAALLAAWCVAAVAGFLAS